MKKKRTRPFKAVFKDHAGRITVSSFETREARELALARQAAIGRGFVTGWVEEAYSQESNRQGKESS